MSLSHEHFGAYELLQALDSAPFLLRHLAVSHEDRGPRCIIQRLAPSIGQNIEHLLAYRDAIAQEARLNNDSIVSVREIGEWQGQPYIVYEIVEGITGTELLSAVSEGGGVELPSVISATLIGGALKALLVAQEQGVLQLALSTDMLIIDDVGDVYVTGFSEGQMSALLRPRVDDQGIRSPELRRGQEIGEGGAIYALAALLYRLLTGNPQPDEWEARRAGMMMELSSAGLPGDSLNKGTRFFQKALAERPSQRFESLTEFAEAYQDLLEEMGGPKHHSVVANALGRFFDACPKPSLKPLSVSSSPRPTTQRSFTRRVSSPEISRHQAPSGTTQEREVVPTGEENASFWGSENSKHSLPQEEGWQRDDLLSQSLKSAPSTRVLSNHSRPSMRSINPALREKLGPHPLDLLARTRYQVLDELGVGGTGTVYKVLDITLNEVLALKVLKSDLASDSIWLQRFKRELKTTRDLNHPNITPAYHLEQIEGLFFFTMRYIEGETLHERIQKKGCLALDEAVRILNSVGEALEAAHARQIIHRDFKSANIMIERFTEEAFLMDFGIASTPEISARLTMTGQGIGTPMYMAPEQALGKPVGPQADIYSFGVVLYEILGGRLPFNETTTVAIYNAQINCDYPPLRSINSTLPKALYELIDACLQPKENARPATMRSVLEQLNGLTAQPSFSA